jgi:hypothetical protein
VPTGKNWVLANKGDLASRLGRVEPKDNAEIAELRINVERPVVRGHQILLACEVKTACSGEIGVLMDQSSGIGAESDRSPL